MKVLTLREIARATGGIVQGEQVLCAGPGHSQTDKSLAIRLSYYSPLGFIVHSYSGDDFREAKDFVAAKLGFAADAWRIKGQGCARPTGASRLREQNLKLNHVRRVARARALWEESRDAHGTVAEAYLRTRGLELPQGSDVIRFNPQTPWKDDDSATLIYTTCMISLFRDVMTNEIRCVQRTRLSPNGEKLGRKMSGPSAGAAIKIDDDTTVHQGIVIGEGLETAMTGQIFGLKPAWALGSASGIATFPVLSGVDGITILGEAGHASAMAVDACGRRWSQAGHEVIVIDPIYGSDINDSLQEVSDGRRL